MKPNGMSRRQYLSMLGLTAAAAPLAAAPQEAASSAAARYEAQRHVPGSAPTVVES